ncbi:hypothetical protein JQK87_28070 [Streptomyces sp. G44]|uniref:hypothetical protein n=1 Tax=Streptomyces sp. G44 TaxID=2807632 RepID=UPI001960D13D|nr:hypothetical protein [Streptomyces sp. G44]MBM7172184.1 hypothetical protein [Streptomyces sp. G44]
MPHKTAATAGVLALALSLAGMTSAAAQAGREGELSVAPGSVRPGARITLSVLNPELMDQMDDAHRVTVRSDAFSGPVKLSPSGKVSWKGLATIRCDAEPGEHSLRFDEPVPPEEARTNGTVRVEAGGAVPGAECAGQAGPKSEAADWTPVTVGIAAGSLAVLATLVFFAVRRRHHP